MQIAELGEFALIDRLNEGVSPVNAATLTARACSPRPT